MRLEDLPARVGAPTFVDDLLVLPGLVNAHDHLEFDVFPTLAHGPYADYLQWGEDVHRRDRAVLEAAARVPREVRLRWGALRNLLAGFTWVGHHGDRRDPIAGLPVGVLPGTALHSVALARRWRLSLNAPGRRSPFVVHVAEGASRAMRHELPTLERWNLLRRPLVGVHGIALGPEDAAKLRALVWCPASNELLYGVTADVAALSGRTTVLLGTDSTLTGPWDPWEHVRAARTHGGLDDAALWAALTKNAGGVFGVDSAGDRVIARRPSGSPWDAVYSLRARDVLRVERAGRVVLADASLGVPASGGSRVRSEGRELWVDEDVPRLLAALRVAGVSPNLPLS